MDTGSLLLAHVYTQGAPLCSCVFSIVVVDVSTTCVISFANKEGKVALIFSTWHARCRLSLWLLFIEDLGSFFVELGEL